MSAKSFLVSPGPAITLASGAAAGSMDTVKADPDDPHNRRLIEAGRLIEQASKKTAAKATTEKENA